MGGGTSRRPVRIPDGLEVKTCRDAIKVDCHHPHVGLHLVVVFAAVPYKVLDVAVAFLKAADYKQAERNTTATTEKFSFGGARFTSLLRKGE